MHPELAPERSSSLKAFRHWQSLSDGFLVSIVIVGPTFLFEELWRGRPMIGQGGALWVIPAVIMAIGFFAGGRLAGRNRGSHRAAFFQGIAAATLTLLLIFLADLVRRAVLVQGVTTEVVAIWAACAAGALVAGGVGGLHGRRGARLSRMRAQLERFH